jgi:hypothetical protein
MKGISPLHHFLGVSVERRPRFFFLHQRTYLKDVFDCVTMTDCKPCTTPVNLESKLLGDCGLPVQDAS